MKHIVSVIIFILTATLFAQNEPVNWISFETLEAQLQSQPKKVMIYFYADWCEFCKKMEADVYSKPEIVQLINAEYYAVKFDAESRDTIHFGGKVFLNLNQGKSRVANHQLADLLAQDENNKVTLPALVFFDEKFNLIDRKLQYLAPNELLNLLQD